MVSWFGCNSSHYLVSLQSSILFVQFVNASQPNDLLFSERDPVQDEVPRLRVAASLLPGGPQLPQPVPVRDEARRREARVQLLGGARVIHPRQGRDEAPAQCAPQEGRGHRVSVQKPPRSDVPSILV